MMILMMKKVFLWPMCVLFPLTTFSIIKKESLIDRVSVHVCVGVHLFKENPSNFDKKTFKE